MLQAGIDITVIALWVGDKSSSTTPMYVEADLAMKMKERALNKVQPRSVQKRPFQPTDRLLELLRGFDYARLTAI